MMPAAATRRAGVKQRDDGDVRCSGASAKSVLGVRRRLTVVGFAGLVVLGGAAQASAATLNVCPSGCTYSRIQDAIDHAHNGDTIKIAAAASPYAAFNVPGGNTNGLNSVTLEGAGAGRTTITTGEDSGQVVGIDAGSVTLGGVTINGNPGTIGITNSGTLTLNNSTVTNNTTDENGDGGSGILNFGTMTLNASTVSHNGGSGGPSGIGSSGTLTLNNSTVSNNTAFVAAGIDSFQGAVTLNNSTVSNNVADLSGGAIFNSEGTVTLNNSTVSNNRAFIADVVGIDGVGAGIYNIAFNVPGATPSAVTLNNSTITSNTAGNSGGGIANIASNGPGAPSAVLTLNNSTITDNAAGTDGGGIFNDDGTTTLRNSQVTGNTANENNTATPGGGIWTGDGGTLTLSSSIVRCNDPDNIFGSYTQKTSRVGGGSC